MPNSLKAKLSKLRYKNQITDKEYKELINKLNGHDRNIKYDILQEAMNKMYDVRDEYWRGDTISVAAVDACSKCIDILREVVEKYET